MNAEQQQGGTYLGDGGRGGTRADAAVRQQTFTALDPQRALTDRLMEQVCDSKNLVRAYRRVRSNKGKPGVDGMTVGELADWLRSNHAALTASLLGGTYQPQPVRGVQIPKPGGGQRQLGIPVAVDRLVQQAILQVLNPILDPTFSNSSYGFRPGRDAHMALEQARKYVAQEGREIVVDLDLEKFFDRVNHDILMSRVARRIGGKRLLLTIRRFLQAGMMQDGVCVTRDEGTPQGGPLTPWTQKITTLARAPGTTVTSRRPRLWAWIGRHGQAMPDSDGIRADENLFDQQAQDLLLFHSIHCFGPIPKPRLKLSQVLH